MRITGCLYLTYVLDHWYRKSTESCQTQNNGFQGEYIQYILYIANLDNCIREADTLSLLLIQNGCYETSSEEEGILRGKLVMVNEGIQFVLGQIVAGICHFSQHLDNSMNDFEEFLRNYVQDENDPDVDDHHNDGSVSNDDCNSSDADEEEYDSDHP